MTKQVETISSLVERPHWTVINGHATFAPVPGGWRATLRRLHGNTGDDRYHVAIIDRTGALRFTSETASLYDATRSAERGVFARNALRLTPRSGHG